LQKNRLKNEDLVQALIQAGADVNGCDFYGHTPLWYFQKYIATIVYNE